MARILIVEDNEDLRNFLRMKLESAGFKVTVAPSGAEALELMASEPADMVLTDVFMPEKDGMETIVEIRARYPQATIIAMSGWDSRSDADYLRIAREIGAVRTFRKPFEPEQMVEVLRQLANPPG